MPLAHALLPPWCWQRPPVGLYFTPAVVAVVLGLGPAIALGVLVR